MMIHELVHASQVERLKQEKGFWWASDYWSANVYQQASNGENPYGQKGGSRWQQIALSEGWGYFMENKMGSAFLKNYTPYYNSGFPYYYQNMFAELYKKGFSCNALEKSLCAYSLNKFRNNLINFYPNSSDEITSIIKNYE